MRLDLERLRGLAAERGLLASYQHPLDNGAFLILTAQTAYTGSSRLTFEVPPGKLSLRVAVEGIGSETLDSEIRELTIPDFTSPQTVISTPEVFRARTVKELQQIKSDPRLRDIPVVMMTGVSDEDQMRRAAASGANSYTIKPANAEQFLRTVLASTWQVFAAATGTITRRARSGRPSRAPATSS